MSAAITLSQLREGDVDIQFLVERIEALVVNGRKVPMTSQVILEQEAILDLIDQLRVAIPEEVKQARRINQESDRVLSKVFFFQAEDGIRDLTVTGVQTCALPI